MNQIEWSDGELFAAVDAYVWMLSQEAEGIPYSKIAVNRRLRGSALSKRSRSSIEYRMENISAVLEELGLPRIKGYMPAQNVGAGVRERIRNVLAVKGNIYDGNEQSANDGRAIKPTRLLGNRIPSGTKKPVKSKSKSSKFLRNALVRAWILNNARGMCEGCGKAAPFVRSSGEPYLEVHHVKPLADGGPDCVTNALALCPNCHRRCHESIDKIEFTQVLLSNVERLRRGS